MQYCPDAWMQIAGMPEGVICVVRPLQVSGTDCVTEKAV